MGDALASAIFNVFFSVRAVYNIIFPSHDAMKRSS
jgi:hypothetical protein